MSVQVKSSTYKVREVEAIDGNEKEPGLRLGDLRKLVAAADKAKLDDTATVYAGHCRESSSQPGRWFVGTLLVQEIEG